MEINVAIGGGQKMRLTGAILVYQGGHEAFAAWHPAKAAEDGAAPYLGEAEPLTTEFLRALSSWSGRRNSWSGGLGHTTDCYSSASPAKRVIWTRSDIPCRRWFSK